MRLAPDHDPPKRCESFWEYRELFRMEMRRAYAAGSAEISPDYRQSVSITPLNERLIQAIWSNQLLQPEGLRLVDGTPLRVLDPGRWNGSAGPDFQAARIMLGDRIVTGDVEVHMTGSEWRAHRHESDLDYNAVVLHVIHRNDDGRADDVLHNGSRLPRFEMEPYIFPDLETIRRSMSPDDYPYQHPGSLGRCYEMMISSDATIVADFLDRAGDERLASKVARLQEQLRGAALDQVFYQALMMALGAGSGKSLYYLLAKRTPPAEMADDIRELPPEDRVRGYEAILLHVAGLVPSVHEELADAPEESREYAAHLRGIWKRFEPCWSDRVIAPTRRWYRDIRPVNFPARRLAAVARLLARSLASGHGLLEDLLARIQPWIGPLKDAKPAKKLHPALKDLLAWLEIEAERAFWATHYSFAAAPSSKPLALIGAATSRSLLFNAVIPTLALVGRERGQADLAEAAHRLYSIFPPLQPNHITDFMAYRLFGESGRARDLITTERRQQALFQVFYSCCNGEERHCDACYYR